ncbi:MAG: sortase [Anaerolineaceae bacterium]|nr:sortase [Anaerolineaceae bacterium]
MSRHRLPIYKSRSAASTLFQMILLGVIFGVGFLVFDRWRTPLAPSGQPASTIVPLTIIETLQPTIPPPPAQAQAVLISTPQPRTTLLLPTVGVNMPIIEAYLSGSSWDVAHLGQNVGHLEGTAWFDAPGNVALSGHVELADGRAGVFARLNQINLGDPIFVSFNGQQIQYIVTEVRVVPPDDISVLYPTLDSRLTLITCSNYDFLQDAYQERTVVIAERAA